MIRRRMLCVLLVTIVAALTLNMGLSSSEQAKYGGVLRIALEADPPHLIPCTTSIWRGRMVSYNIFPGLVKYNWDMQPVPWFAESWEMSPDGLSWTFHLVDTKWSDGVPFTSEDVRFSYEEIVAEYHPRGKTIMEHVDHIETPDPRTVVFKMKDRFPPFMMFSTLEHGGIIPKHEYEGVDILNDDKIFNPPCGVGPYLFKKWTRGSEIVLEKNPNYFKSGQPYFDEIIFRIYPSPEGRVLALEAGEVDIIPGYIMTYSEVKRLEDAGFKVTTKGSEAPSIVLLYFNGYNVAPHTITSDLKVRQAIAYAIDNEKFLDLVGWGIGIPSYTQYPSVYWGTKDAARYDYNLEKANNLLDEAGYPKGADGIRFELDLVLWAKRPFYEKGAEVIRDTLRDIGISIKLRPMDVMVAGEECFINHNYDLHLFGATSGPDPAIAIDRFYHSKYYDAGIIFQGGLGYNNSHVDELLDQGAVEMDVNKRKEIYDEVQKIYMDELPSYPIMEQNWPMVYNPKLGGKIPGEGVLCQMGPLDEAWWTELEEVAQPPYLTYAVVAIVIIAGVGVGVYYAMRRKTRHAST